MNAKPLRQARARIPYIIEDIGTLAMHIREANDFAAFSSALPAIESCNDALASIDSAIRELSNMRDKIGRWALTTETEAAP